MSFQPCIGCGATYAEGAIGTVHKEDCPEVLNPCLRCGCRIEAGQHRAYNFKSCDPPGYLQAYLIAQHLHPDDCMVALRRREVENKEAWDM